MNRFTSRDSRAFALIGLLIAVTGILAAIAMPLLLDPRETAEDSAANGGMHNIALGVAGAAVGHGDTCPAAVAEKIGLVDAGGTGLTLAGHKSDDDFVVPSTGVAS